MLDFVKMEKFGFIIHATKIEDVYRLNAGLRFIPKKILEIGLKLVKPFKVFEVSYSCPLSGEEIKGYFVGCAFLPRQVLDLDPKFVVSKIIAACRIAQGLGAKIIGLGGYTSIAVEKSGDISDKLDVPVTSGNTYTAWAVIEAVSRQAQSKGIDLKQATIAIIGATGAIGSLCAKKLAFSARKIIITARHREKLDDLKSVISGLNVVEVIVKENPHLAVKDADIVITTTSSPDTLLDAGELKPCAIACDVSIPANMYGVASPANDITSIKGGLIKLPVELKFNPNIDIGLPKNIIYACAAETMLLTLEKKFTTYSLGKNIELGKLEEIASMAARHGFEVAL